ncbi:SWIM-type domain-containing protein [Aphis craccivora]|uniref:SWIM-type domain-containing protein n=1 Tax=Aphis craccivora TaxID=307492 RepID=A0A6G0VY24_APHCR|nr:SWIM-type domain-containing protein [Aphis craccivora]
MDTGQKIILMELEELKIHLVIVLLAQEENAIIYTCPNNGENLQRLENLNLISMHNILSIPCSLSTLLKEESLTQTERQCKQILNSIIDQVELDLTYSLNKNHFSLILLNQKILFINNTPSTKFPLNFNEDCFYFTNIALLADNLLTSLLQKFRKPLNIFVFRLARLIIHHKTPWCPISCKNKQIIENGVPNLKYLEFVNNKLELKKSNVYYTQVQPIFEKFLI